MMNRLSIILLLLMSTASMSLLYAQDFEGIMILFSKTSHAENTAILTVKGDKSMLEVERDSSESITMIIDKSTATSTMLRRKNELKYGYRIRQIYEKTHERLMNPESHTVTVSSDEKESGSCYGILLRNEAGSAEACVVKNKNYSLSDYFPDFLSDNLDIGFFTLRQAAEKEGLIQRYSERRMDGTEESVFQLKVEEKEIPLDLFNVEDEYIVLDQEGMKRLYQESLHDAARKKQWEEFSFLFGEKK